MIAPGLAAAAVHAAEWLARPETLTDAPGVAQSLSSGAAGIALLHAERAASGTADWEPVVVWLKAATGPELETGDRATLLFGVPAVAFALHAPAQSGRYGRAATALDEQVTAITRARLQAAHARMDRGTPPELAEFDLFKGLTGLGAHLLRRGNAGELLREVLAYLVRLTEPRRDGLPGWWTSEPPRGGRRTTENCDGGHGNLGMAHGISGPLAMLSTTARRGITVNGQADAISAICGWTDLWRQDTPAGAWWPEIVTTDDVRAGLSHQPAPARPSWCYGTPGQARAQQLAALATRDQARQHTAQHALIACLQDPEQTSRIIDAGLCHGWAGVFQTVWRAAADCHGEDHDQLRALLPGIAARLTDEAVVTGPGLLLGAAGPAAALHTAATDRPPASAWDAFLLLA